MNRIMWKNHPQVDGRIGFRSPYNQVFVDALKAAVPSAVFTRGDEIWWIDEEARADALPLLKAFFVDLRWYRVVWQFSRDNPSVDGTWLMYIERDRWNWRRNNPFKKRVVAAELKSGGSRNYPGISGSLTIDILMRQDVILDPEPESVTELNEADLERPNPLSIYSPDDLIAELERRGYEAMREK